MNHFSINLNPYIHRHPDRLADDFNKCAGEFSIDFDYKFRQYLIYLDKCREKGRDFIEDYKHDLKRMRKSIRKKVGG